MPYSHAVPYPCDFCEFIAGRLPWQPVIETPRSVAFINLRQRSLGSVLIAPRRHAFALTELTEDELVELMALVQTMSRAATRAFDPDGLHVWCNIGTQAGQSIPHTHFQVVPRYHGTEYSFDPSTQLQTVSVEERRRLAKILLESAQG